MNMLRLLVSYKVDTSRVNQDGTAPVHVAAAGNSLEVIKLLHELGVDMQQRGSIYLDDFSTSQPFTEMTPLAIATKLGRSEIVEFLATLEQEADPPAKRQRSEASLSVSERAALADVSARLQPVPELTDLLARGCDHAAARKKIHQAQKSNQQIVARAENQQQKKESRLKQSALTFGSAGHLTKR